MTTHTIGLDHQARAPRPSDRLLRSALKGDALACAASGAATLATAPLLGPLLGLPAALSLPLGVVLVGYAAAAWWVGTRADVPRRAAWACVAFNVLWIADSLALLASGWAPLTALGVGFVALQATVVAAFAALQVAGLRRAARPAHAPAR
jgi:hypothetical protein